MGYDAETTGISAGYERWLGEILCGLDVNLARTDLDVTGAGFEESREEIETKGIGLYVMGTYSENIVWRGRVAGLWATHDYEGLTGIDLTTRERARYKSSGFIVTEMIGRLFCLGADNVLLPEIGGEYLYLQRERFTTEATAATWTLDDSRIGDNQVMGIASLRWLGRMMVGGMPLVPSVSAGARILLTDEMIGETQTVGSSSTLVRIEQDKVAGTVGASCLLNISKTQQAELVYDGAFSGYAAQHAFSVCWRMKF
jgi:outer membrane autotransporter protein